MPGQPGKLIILSGPSGVGKSTVVAELLKRCALPLELSVSATTRKPRVGEQHGVQYWFIDPAEFQARRDRSEFLECFEVFGRGVWYGTLLEPVTSGLNAGKWVILEIDVQGARRVLERFPEAITVFIQPENLQELERRLRGRHTEDETELQRRLEVARKEMESAHWYRHIVANVHVDSTVDEICQILKSYREPTACTKS